MKELSPDLAFDEVWLRIQKATGIKTLTKLAKVLKVKQPSVSRAKKEGKFPIKWAIDIAFCYVLNTDWVLYGRGPEHYGMAAFKKSNERFERLKKVLDQATKASTLEEYEVCLEVAEKLREEIIEPNKSLTIEEKVEIADDRILELEDEIEILKREKEDLYDCLYKDVHLGIVDLKEWLTEAIREDPGRKDWFRLQMEDFFPSFREWLKKRDSESEGSEGRCA